MEDYQAQAPTSEYQKKVNLLTTKIDFLYMSERQVSSMEYCFLEMISCLSTSNSAYGFRCNATYEYLALQLGISLRSAKGIAKSLVERGLLIIYNYGNAKLTRCSEKWQPPRKSYDYTIVDHAAARTIGIEVDEMLCLDTIFQGSRLLKREAYTFGAEFLAERLGVSVRSVTRILAKMKSLGFIKQQAKKIYIENKWIKERFGNNTPNIPAVIYGKNKVKKVSKKRDLSRQICTLDHANFALSSEVLHANFARNSNVFNIKGIDSNSKDFDDEKSISCLVRDESCLVRESSSESSTAGIDKNKKRQSPPIAPPPPLEKIHIQKNIMQVEKSEFAAIVTRHIDKKMRGSDVDAETREEIISSFIDFLVSINFELKVEPKTRDYPKKSKDYQYMRDRSSYQRSIDGLINMFGKHVSNRLKMNGGSLVKTITSKEDPKLTEFVRVMSYFYEGTQTRSFFEGFHQGDVDYLSRTEEVKGIVAHHFKAIQAYKEEDVAAIGMAFLAIHRTTGRLSLSDFMYKLRYNYEDFVMTGKRALKGLNQEGKSFQRIKTILCK